MGTQDGCDKHVADGELVLLAVENDGAVALEDLEDGRADLAARRCDGAGAQAVELGADRRHDVAAGRRVDVAHCSVALLDCRRLAFVLEQELLGQRPVGEFPAIGADRRADRVLQARQRTQARMAPKPLAARKVRRGIVGHAIGAELEETDIHLLRERDVQAVDPGHRLVGVVVVSVEAPSGRQQKVAPAHAHRIAVDHRPDALALDHEAEGVLRMAMFRRRLARTEILDRGPERRADIGVTAEAGIGEPDGPPLATASDRHQLARLFGKRQELRPLPDMGDRLGFRMHRHQIAELRPERNQMLLLEPFVEGAQFRRVFRLHGMVDIGMIEFGIHGVCPLVEVMTVRLHRAGSAALRP